jgi:uncharacterized protein (TIGR00251 family)
METIEIKVKANSKKESITQKDNIYIVEVKAKAEDNKANIAVIKLLKKHFNKTPMIIKGLTSKNKVVRLI